MSFLQSLPKQTLFRLKIAGIGTMSIAALAYFNHRSKTSSLSQAKYNEESFSRVYTPTFSKNIEAQNGINLGRLPIENRIEFIKKVYGLVFAQLVAVAGSTALAFRHIHRFRGAIIPMSIAGFVGVLGSIIVMNTQKVRNSENLKKVCLGVFTIAEMMTFPVLCLGVPRDILMSGLLNTAIITGALTAYANTSKHDFTIHGGMITALLFGFMGMSLLMLFFPNRMAMNALSWAGAGLFSFTLLHDTQALLGKGVCKYNYGDYDRAAVAIYLDIVNLFINMINIMMLSKKK